MNYSYCWCNITGKVFVSEDELMERLSERFPEKCHRNEELGAWVTTTKAEEEKEVFEIIAREKLNEKFDTDEPMKLSEIEIDLDTYKS